MTEEVVQVLDAVDDPMPVVAGAVELTQAARPQVREWSDVELAQGTDAFMRMLDQD